MSSAGGPPQDQPPRPGHGNRRVTPSLPEVTPVPDLAPVSTSPAVEVSFGPAPSAQPDPHRPESRRPSRRKLWWGLGSSVLLTGALVGAWFGLPVRQIQVSGQAQLSEAQVQRLAGLTPGFGWLYYGGWRAGGLKSSPWIESAIITRQFPDTVRVEVTERVPYARWQRPDGRIVTIARNGTVLPGAPSNSKLPLLGGWGPDRLSDALTVTRTLSRYTVQSVAYSPAGVSVKTALGTVWSGDLKSLVKYAGSIGMYPNKRIHIYPWGVSVQE